MPGTRVWSPSTDIIVELEGDNIEEIVKSSISLIVGSRFGLDDSRFGRDISGFGRFAGDRCASIFPSSIVTCLSSNSTFFGPEIDAKLIAKEVGNCQNYPAPRLVGNKLTTLMHFKWES